MTAEDADRWDARYADHPLAEPSRPDALTDELADQIATTGRALDVACGAGGPSLWLAARGLDVIALDVSDTAVQLVTAAADRAESGERIDARVVDLDQGLAASLGVFDVIVCQRFRATHLYPDFVDRLRLDGIAIVTVLSRTGTADPGPFHAPSGELARAFTRNDCHVLRHVEADGQESIVVRRTST